MSADARKDAPEVTMRDEGEREVLTVGRWELSRWKDLGDGEPRVLDTDAATVLQFGRPRDIRRRSQREWW